MDASSKLRRTVRARSARCGPDIFVIAFMPLLAQPVRLFSFGAVLSGFEVALRFMRSVLRACVALSFVSSFTVCCESVPS